MENLPYTDNQISFIKDIKSPCSVFICTNPVRTGGGSQDYDWLESQFDNIVNMANLLREHGIDAVPCFSKSAEDPSKTVVTARGIQTPVLKGKIAKKAAEKLYK